MEPVISADFSFLPWHNNPFTAHVEFGLVSGRIKRTPCSGSLSSSCACPQPNLARKHHWVLRPVRKAPLAGFTQGLIGDGGMDRSWLSKTAAACVLAVCKPFSYFRYGVLTEICRSSYANFSYQIFAGSGLHFELLWLLVN